MNKFYAKDRKTWRNWLAKNHDKEKEVWLVRYHKASGKKCISYEDSVQESLCFGWIDSTVRSNDKESTIQRFTPRNPKSRWSELNRERARRLVAKKLMTPAGAFLLPKDLNETYKYPADIITELKKDREVWENFEKFPEYYKRVRMAYIDESRVVPQWYKSRLNNFIKATKKNRKIGTIL